jgi:threonine synthase
MFLSDVLKMLPTPVRKIGGNLDVVLDYDVPSRNTSLRISRISLAERSLACGGICRSCLFACRRGGDPAPRRGRDPCLSVDLPREKLGLQNLWLKDESKNPTASFKDRASAIVVARAQEIKAEVVVTASTGNAGAALAGMSAAVGQKAVIFAPKSAPQAKVAQLLIFGAKVILVDGTYDDAFDLTIKACK